MSFVEEVAPFLVMMVSRRYPVYRLVSMQRFTGWSEEIHEALDATSNSDVEQRDLYDRPPSVSPISPGRL